MLDEEPYSINIAEELERNIMEDKKKDLIEMYNTLYSSGVHFYYDDEEVQYGEITDISIKGDSKILLKINYEDEYETTLEKFQNYHTKENINYYDWSDVRKFDEILEELVDSL